MPRDDYFRITYLILSELYQCRKDGVKVDVESISDIRFGIAYSYWLSIIEDLLEDGYIKGVIAKECKTGKYLLNLEDIDITRSGIEYLQDNSKMNKVMEVLKNIKEITPCI